MDLGTSEFWQHLKDDPAGLARQLCTIDMVNLDRTLEQHPALRAWINAAYEVARVEEEKCKWTLTKAEAIATLLFAKEKDPLTKKAKLATIIKAEVSNDLEVKRAMNKLHAQMEIRGALKAVVDALADRKDMLVQISANQRKERGDY